MVRIPKIFSLMNRDYIVSKATDDEQDDMDRGADHGLALLGFCDYEASRIVLGRHRTREALEHTYFHELAHSLLEAIGRPKLSRDEALVDALGAALHQYEKTKAGSLPLRMAKKNEQKTGSGAASPGKRGSRLVDRRHMVRSQRG
jgi:hypothetical protein